MVCWSDVVRDKKETKLSWYQYSQKIQLLNRVGEKDKLLEKRMPTISLLIGFASYGIVSVTDWGSIHPCNLQNQVMTASLVCGQSLLLHLLSKRLWWWTWSGRDQVVDFVSWYPCTVLLCPLQLVSYGQVVTTCTCFLNGDLWHRYCVCKTVQYYVSAYKNRISLLIHAGHNYSDSKD